eukprot:CAMPEP_0194033418 /NCGR_PEP_ID=MMETSP0009_2-20130614/6125_1 /TAXON_ID=210454 /ORGANISM="Grammatophora oceanica, Strain CCMP 410" /LENGTH=251 /DNA_ID=CAMNT_0038674111 /DNA_START=63 /DNA_END=818 /DNA_ORIENTATION=+
MGNIFVNEVNYNNCAGGTTFVEIAGPAAATIDDVPEDFPFYELYIFNQEGDCIGFKEALIGVADPSDPSVGIDDYGFQTFDLMDSDLPPEGFGLIVQDFLQIDRDMVAFGGSDIVTTGSSAVGAECDLTETGIVAGMLIPDTGVAEMSVDEDGSQSLQRTGCGATTMEFDCWVGPLESTKGVATVGQLIQESEDCPAEPFICPESPIITGKKGSKKGGSSRCESTGKKGSQSGESSGKKGSRRRRLYDSYY